jgi:hypothetical protein
MEEVDIMWILWVDIFECREEGKIMGQDKINQLLRGLQDILHRFTSLLARTFPYYYLKCW